MPPPVPGHVPTPWFWDRWHPEGARVALCGPEGHRALEQDGGICGVSLASFPLPGTPQGRASTC